jgi:gas vesicle protein
MSVFAFFVGLIVGAVLGNVSAIVYRKHQFAELKDKQAAAQEALDGALAAQEGYTRAGKALDDQRIATKFGARKPGIISLN